MTNPESFQRYPLQWPGNWPRTRSPRVAAFRRTEWSASIRVKDGLSQLSRNKKQIILSIASAVDRLEYQLGEISATQHVLSTNIEPTLSGRPRGNAADPIDVGAAVYFKLNGANRCLACDRWTRVADNIAALAAHIDALRRIDRYGVGTLDQAFRGYTALQAATCEWWLILGVSRDAPIDTIEAAFTRLAKTHHPDKGGDTSQMARLTEARNLARQDRRIA